MFFDLSSSYANKSTGFISQKEEILLDSVRLHDLIVISENRIKMDSCFHDDLRQNMESDKLMNYL